MKTISPSVHIISIQLSFRVVPLFWTILSFLNGLKILFLISSTNPFSFLSSTYFFHFVITYLSNSSSTTWFLHIHQEVQIIMGERSNWQKGNIQSRDLILHATANDISHSKLCGTKFQLHIWNKLLQTK